MSYSSGIEGAIISGTSSFFQILLAHFLYKDDALNMRKVIEYLSVFVVSF